MQHEILPQPAALQQILIPQQPQPQIDGQSPESQQYSLQPQLLSDLEQPQQLILIQQQLPLQQQQQQIFLQQPLNQENNPSEVPQEILNQPQQIAISHGQSQQGLVQVNQHQTENNQESKELVQNIQFTQHITNENINNNQEVELNQLNAGNYGEKINGASKLIESTKNLITGEDVLKLNEAISEKSETTVESTTAKSVVSEYNTEEAISTLLTRVQVNYDGESNTITPTTEINLEKEPIVVADYEDNSIKSTTVKYSETTNEGYSTTTNVVDNESTDYGSTPAPDVLVTPRPIGTNFLAPITAGVQLQSIEESKSANNNKHYFVEIQKSLPYYLGKYEFIQNPAVYNEQQSIQQNVSVEQKAMENIELGNTLLYFPINDKPRAEALVQQLPQVNINQQFSQERFNVQQLPKPLIENKFNPKVELTKSETKDTNIASSEENKNVQSQHVIYNILESAEQYNQGSHAYQENLKAQQIYEGQNYQQVVQVPVVVQKVVEKPVPYPVVQTKIVEKPVPVTKYVKQPYPVEVPVHIPIHVPYPVEKQVPIAVPVEKIVEKPIHITKYVEKPVHIPQPYPVEKIVEKPVEVTKYVDRPYPVEVRVPHPVPYAVEKLVQVPVQVPVEKPVPQYIEKIIEKPVAQYINTPYPVGESNAQNIYGQQYLNVDFSKFIQKPVAVSHVRISQGNRGQPGKYTKTGTKVQSKNHGRLEQYTQQSQQQQTVVYNNPYAYAPTHLKHYIPPKQELLLTKGYVPPKLSTNGYLPPKSDCEQQLAALRNLYFTIKHDDYIGLLPPKQSSRNVKFPRKLRQARSNFNDNPRVEYGFMPPLVPSLEIDENGKPIEKGDK